MPLALSRERIPGAGAYGQYITVLPALDMVVAHKTAVGGGRGFGGQTRFSEYRGILERLADALHG